MKNIIYFVLNILLIEIGYTQGYDNIWVFGNTGITANKQGGNLLAFSNNQISVDTIKLPIKFRQTASNISDSIGNLLFYTNGVKVINHNHEIMENGDSLSPCPNIYEHYQSGYGGYTPYGALILPHPKLSNIYYLFHYNYVGIFEPPQNPFWGCSHLLYSIIDMSYNNGLGKVIEKNVPIISSPLTWGCIQAVKHANGHDWWLIIPEYTTRYYHRVLIDINGIRYIGKQLAGPNIVIDGEWDNSFSKFSPQDDKYVRFRPPYQIHYFHFDRCTGLLSDVELISLNLAKNVGDVEFSPNGNLLYISNSDTIFQLDLTASNILATKMTVAVYDGYQSPFGSFFNIQKLAPDGKIYLNCGNGEDVLHVIENPNAIGIACNVLQHTIHLPNYNQNSLPNHPNYHLGAMVCDTTVSYQSALISEQSKVYPNPAQDMLYIELPQVQGATFILYDITGKEVVSQTFEGSNAKIMLGKLPKGVYFYRLFYNNKKEYGKLLIE